MYSLGVYEQHQRKAKAEADRQNKTSSKNWHPAKRNRFLANIYERDLHELATASIVRRDANIQQALLEPEATSMLGEPTVPIKGGAYVSWNAMAPSRQLAHPHNQFRDTFPEKELGGLFGVSKYVARAYFKGGGLFNAEKTIELKAKTATEGGARAVDALDPREATVSLGGLGMTLKKGPYANPGHFLRVRQRAKELGPPFVFKARTECERITAQLSVETLNDAGPWTPKTAQLIQYPQWRYPDPAQFQEPFDFRRYHGPALIDTHQTNGLPNVAPMSVSELYADPLQKTYSTLPPGSLQWNAKQPNFRGRVSGTFGEYSPPKRKEATALHCSLRGTWPRSNIM